MTEIENKIKDSLNSFCDRFITEKIGSSKLVLMPPKYKCPKITYVNYEKDVDTFEIRLNKDFTQYINGNAIDLSKDDNGHLAAIRIKNFSNLDKKYLMGNAIATIEKEIERLSKNIDIEQDIANCVIDKRILLFIRVLIKKNYYELKKAYLNISG